MPNPKVGSVTSTPVDRLMELKKGRVDFRVDKGGGIHAGCGRMEWRVEDLFENVCALVAAVAEAKPVVIKGAALSPTYIKTCTVASSFGRGYRVSPASLYEAVRNYRGKM